ncbi:energy-coupling factor transporter transmembrane protein EcfT [Corynebacterium sp. HMSC11E11]|uniref:energy-coupling factor transporter transmembrane component T family protein n=1 Tax=Corynebacterium sp. HMSC11E11 TaxID=1581089 RepID=UPI0008A62A20|nr:energy-coupling factor transporter transmembrane component T [Corynebacterium sp. HMSC11E11]OFU60332.1 ABC transporter permease [Corynebacterium sp. HMSC11E11]
MRATPLEKLDPRVALIGLVVVDAALLTVGTELMEITGAVVAVICLIAALRPVAAIVMGLAEALVLVLGHVILPAAEGTTSEVLTVLLFAMSFTYRFAVVSVIAWAVIGGITTGALQAFLGWARVPRILAVPSLVAVRFLPVVVVDDARTIRDNLVLRGVVSSGASLLLHPIVAVRHAVLPLVATSLRTGDELSASALLRGLGSRRRTTSVVELRLGFPDVVAMVIVAAVVALAVKEKIG